MNLKSLALIGSILLSPLSASAQSWADPRFPHIDYSTLVFEAANLSGAIISGWWTINKTIAPIDDSVNMTALNMSAPLDEYQDYGTVPKRALMVMCFEGEAKVFYMLKNKYLVPDSGKYNLHTIYRIDAQKAVHTKWDILEGNGGIGLFGREAELFLRKIRNAKKLFIRVQAVGQNHDITLDLSGIQDVYEALDKACDWEDAP